MSPKCLVFLPSSFSTMITAPLPPLIYDHSPFPAFLPPSPLSLFLHVAARRSILKSRFIWTPPPPRSNSPSSVLGPTGKRELAHAAFFLLPFLPFLPILLGLLLCVPRFRAALVPLLCDTAADSASSVHNTCQPEVSLFRGCSLTSPLFVHSHRHVSSTVTSLKSGQVMACSEFIGSTFILFLMANRMKVYHKINGIKFDVICIFLLSGGDFL